MIKNNSVQFSSVQLLSCVRLFATPWIAAHQASLSITNSRSSLRLTSIESVMPSSHLILCRPLLLLPPIPPSIRVFANKSTLRMRWPKYWSFSFSIIPSKEIPGLISFRMDWLDLLAVQGTLRSLQWKAESLGVVVSARGCLYSSERAATIEQQGCPSRPAGKGRALMGRTRDPKPVAGHLDDCPSWLYPSTRPLCVGRGGSRLALGRAGALTVLEAAAQASRQQGDHLPPLELSPPLLLAAKTISEGGVQHL